MSPEIPFTFDGEPMFAQPGQTLAATLINQGVVAWRQTRFDDRPRGLFCGIGVCFDCLITVNGEPNVRACMAEVLAGDDVRSQGGSARDEG